MKIYILTGIFLVFVTSNAFCQSDERLKIDSLKKMLPSLHDTIGINCLNELSYYYTLLSNKDSATYFSGLAEAEAKGLNYIHGIAEAVSRKAGHCATF